MMSIRTGFIALLLLISTQTAVAMSPDVILMELHPTKAIDINELREHKYKDVLKGVINNVIEKIMHTETFPIYVPLGETVNLCGNDEDAIPLYESDVLQLVQNLSEIGFSATIHDNPNTPIDTLVIEKIEAAPLPGLAQ